RTATSNAGLAGTIAFDPNPNGPYSAEIGLVQAVNVTDVRGRTGSGAGQPVDWSKIRDQNAPPGTPGSEAARGALMTTGAAGAPRGWNIDTLTATHARGSNAGPNYIEQFGIGGSNQFGWLRSPTDTGIASLADFPNMSFDVDFDFETVARGADNQTVYGSLF